MAIATYTETETWTIREKRERMDMLAVLLRSLVLLNAGEEPDTNRMSETQPESSSYQVESIPVVETETWLKPAKLTRQC
jgi:hypothetical protein